MMKKLGVVVMLFGMIQANAPLYLSLIENGSRDSLYKVRVPAEDYDMMIFPQSEEHLEHWMNLSEQKMFYISTLKGEGETIFVEYGPEPSGACDSEMMPHSVVYWRGSQSTLPENKSYRAYCPTGESPSLAMHIDDDGNPEITPLKDIALIASA